MRSAQFTDRYRALETLLEKKYTGKSRKHTSAVMEYLSDPESRPVRDDLEVAREVRNIIMHNADDEGLPVVEPSSATLAALERAIDYIREPPLALTFSTPSEQLLCAHMNDPVIPLMRAMLKRGFSHAPVVYGETLTGIFSVGTIFSYVAAQPGIAIDEGTRVSQFSELLPFDGHAPEQFRFMDEQATYADVKQAFEERLERNHRLAAVFITDTGEQDRPLLGMITPWDALGRRGDVMIEQQ